jgi:hypothetical protein
VKRVVREGGRLCEVLAAGYVEFMAFNRVAGQRSNLKCLTYKYLGYRRNVKMRRRTKWFVGALMMIGAGSSGIGWAWAEDSQSTSSGVSEVRAASFTDLEGHWALPSIGIALEKGYVDGYEDGSFKPDQQISRAEFVKMAITALKLPISGATTGVEWYLPYVNAAASFGIHRWSDLNTGDWNTPMSRYEMARMASRAAGEDTDEDKKWMYLATKAGLIQGMDDTGTLAEDGTTTRGQAVTIIERILDVKADKELPVDKHAVNRAEVVWHKTNIFTVMPQYFGQVYPGNPWNPDNLFIETPDGLYRGELDALYAIDLSDPNDPFVSVLPDFSTLKWHNGMVDHKGRPLGYSLTDYMNNFVLYFNGREVFRKDNNLYGDRKGFVPLTILGTISTDLDRFVNGDLNDPAMLFVNQIGDVPAFVIPRKLHTTGSFGLELYSPSRSPYPVTRNRIIMSKTATTIE